MAVLPEVSRVIAGSLDVRNIFQELGAAVRTVLDFDLMLVRPIGASGTLQRSMLLVGDMPADLQPERRLEDYSFGARLAAKEIVLLGDARRELDQSFPGDRAALERGVRSVIVAPLVFGDTLGGVLAFAKHDPDWFDEGDAEEVSGIAAQVVVALQHQRLSEEQQRVGAAEQHSRWLERRVERLRGALAERYGFDSIMGRSGAIREALDRQPWSPGRRQRSCSRAKAGPGRSWSLAPSTTPADVPTGRSWRSTAPHCPKPWRSPSSSDMSEERSRRRSSQARSLRGRRRRHALPR